MVTSLSEEVTPFTKFRLFIVRVPVEFWDVVILSDLPFARSMSMLYFVFPLSVNDTKL